MPVWPGEPESAFNEDFFETAPNALLELLPDATPYADVVKMIDLPVVTGGRKGIVVADPRAREALLYLGE